MFLMWKDRSQFRDIAQTILNEMLANYLEEESKQTTDSKLNLKILKLGSSVTRCECTALINGDINGTKCKKHLSATYKTKNDKSLLGMLLGGAAGTAFILESVTPSTNNSEKKTEENNVQKCMEMISHNAFEFLDNKSNIKASKVKTLWIALKYAKWILTFAIMAIVYFLISSTIPRDADFVAKYSFTLIPAITLGAFCYLLLHLISLVVTPNRFFEKEHLGRVFILGSSLETPIQIKVRAIISLVVLTLCFLGAWKLLYGY